MKKKLTYIFIINFFFITGSFAQEITEKETDSIKPKKDLYLRVGVNTIKPIISFFDEDVKGIGIIADMNVYKRFYAAIEFGNEEKTTNEDYFNFTTTGSYFKAGFDFNAYNNWVGMNNDIFFGLRYGVSFFDQTLNNYTSHTIGSYLNPELVTAGTEFTSLNAHWFEFVMGLKVETIKNIYIGMSMSFNKILSTKEPENFKNLYAPGFGRIFSNDTGFGFNYTLSYQIPIRKKNK